MLSGLRPQIHASAPWARVRPPLVKISRTAANCPASQADGADPDARAA
jgi:hypothetical protein